MGDPGSVRLPPRPPAWRLALRGLAIAQEVGAVYLRLLRGVPVEERARKMRETFARLGPAFVKAGQALATRPDEGLPPEALVELAKLQDRMAPFGEREARAVLERELGRPLEELFSELDTREPIAAASLGQVQGG